MLMKLNIDILTIVKSYLNQPDIEWITNILCGITDQKTIEKFCLIYRVYIEFTNRDVELNS